MTIVYPLLENHGIFVDPICTHICDGMKMNFLKKVIFTLGNEGGLFSLLRQ